MLKRLHGLSRVEQLRLVIGLAILTIWGAIGVSDRAWPPMPLLILGLVSLNGVGVRRPQQIQPPNLRLLGLLGVLVMVVSYGVYALGWHQNMIAVALPCAIGLSLVVGAVIGFLRSDS